MPDQRSTQDQIEYLAVLLDDQEWPELAAWVRGEPLPDGYDIFYVVKVASKEAVLHGLYDADDWLKRKLPEEE